MEQWSTIDVTLWNVIFPEMAVQGGPSTGSSPSAANPQKQRYQYQNQPICLDWNENPNGCS